MTVTDDRLTADDNLADLVAVREHYKVEDVRREKGGLYAVLCHARTSLGFGL